MLSPTIAGFRATISNTTAKPLLPYRHIPKLFDNKQLCSDHAARLQTQAFYMYSLWDSTYLLEHAVRLHRLTGAIRGLLACLTSCRWRCDTIGLTTAEKVTILTVTFSLMTATSHALVLVALLSWRDSLSFYKPQKLAGLFKTKRIGSPCCLCPPTVCQEEGENSSLWL